MPLDHSALTEPLGIARAVTGATVADAAVIVTPPAWAHSVDVGGAAAVRVGRVATEGSAMTAFITVPADNARNFPLQTREQSNAAVTYAVSTTATSDVVEFAYIPREP
jgi:hypothetical protein